MGGAFFALRGDNFALPLMRAHAPDVVTAATPLGLWKFEQKPTALVDLGRPSFRLGLTEIEVGRRPHELVVDVHPDRAVFATREIGRAHV